MDEHAVRRSLFGRLKHGKTDAQSLEPAAKHQKIGYPKPDGVLTFDRLCSVFLSNTNHEEDQPIHLQLKDPELQKTFELDVYAGPSTRYCSAGSTIGLRRTARTSSSSTRRTARTARRATSRTATRT